MAIIGGEATEPVRSLLTAEISQQPEMTVLERGQLDKVASEVALQSQGFITADQLRAGQLLHADALLLLLPDEGRKRLMVRLVAVAPGVVLYEDSVPWPVPAAGEWAAIAAKKLGPYLASFHTSKRPRIPLSVLSIHSATAGWESSRMENELGFLLAHRLRSEPSLWVLERSQMGPLEWEKALQASPAAFWTGSYLLDGTVTAEAGGYRIAARLRAPKLGKDIPLTAQGATLLELSSALAGQVTASLQVAQPGKPWDSAAEARQYQDEALWAWRWKLPEEASAASEAAWALGLKNDTVALLRFRADSGRLNAHLFSQESGSEINPPPAWATECALETLDRLQEGLAWKGPELPPEWLGLSVNCLWDCSRLLRAGNFFADGLPPTEVEALATLRARVRTIADSLKPAAEKNPLPKVEEKALGFAPFPVGTAAPNQSLYTVRGVFGAFWQEEARQGAEQLRAVFDDLDRLPPETRQHLKRAIFQADAGYTPWVASWKRGERRLAFAPYRPILLNGATSPERPIDVARMLLDPMRHAEPLYNGRELDPEEIRAAIAGVQEALWNAREAFSRGQISPLYYFDVISDLKDKEFRMPRDRQTPRGGQPAPREASAVEAFRVKLFKYLITARKDDAHPLERFEPDMDKLTPEDMKELAGLIRVNLQRYPEDPTKSTQFTSLQHAYANGGWHAKAPPIPTLPPGLTGQFLPAAWTVTEAQMTGGSAIQNPVVRYRSGCVYLLAQNLGANAAREPNLLFVYNPATGKASRSVYLERLGQNYDLETVGNRLLISGGSKVSSYVAGEPRWSEFAIPEMGDPRLFVVDGRIFVAGSPGILVQLDPATGKAEIVVSSRRRPALNNLDDQPAYDISKVFQDATGRLCLVVDFFRVYRQEAKGHSWTQLFDAQKGPPMTWPEPQVLLAAIGADGFPPRPMGHGQDLALGAFAGTVRMIRRKVDPTAPPPPPKVPIFGMPNAAHDDHLRATDSAVFDGKDLWLLTTDELGQRLLLKRMSAAGEFDHVVPIEIGDPGGQLVAAQMWATPEGIFVYRAGQGAFYRKGDLVNWKQAGGK